MCRGQIRSRESRWLQKSPAQPSLGRLHPLPSRLSKQARRFRSSGRSKRLFHILVHPWLEAQILDRRRLDFFYPKGPLPIGGRSIPARDLLAYIEVPLLCVSPRESLKRELPYAQWVRERRQELECLLNPPGLVLDRRRHHLLIGDEVVRLTPNEFFWYAAMARLVLDGRGRLPVPELVQSLRIDGRGITHDLPAAREGNVAGSADTGCARTGKKVKAGALARGLVRKAEG